MRSWWGKWIANRRLRSQLNNGSALRIKVGIKTVGLPWWLRGYSVCLQRRRPGFKPWIGNISWWRQWHPTPVFLPGKSHGGRSLVDYSPWGHKESDMTERLHFHFSRLLIFIQLSELPCTNSTEISEGTTALFGRRICRIQWGLLLWIESNMILLQWILILTWSDLNQPQSA